MLCIALASSLLALGLGWMSAKEQLIDATNLTNFYFGEEASLYPEYDKAMKERYGTEPRGEIMQQTAQPPADAVLEEEKDE